MRKLNFQYLAKQAAALGILFFISFVAYGQYVPASLINKDGKEQQGFVQLRSISNKNKNEGHELKFREDKNGSTRKVASQELRYLILKGSKGEGQHLLEFFPVEWKGRKRTRITGPFWHKVLKDGEVSVYVYASEYAREKGEIVPKAFSFNYFLKRKSETHGHFLDIGPHTREVKNLIGESTRFVDNASEFFKDYPELVARIQAKELVFSDVFEVVELYNKRSR